MRKVALHDHDTGGLAGAAPIAIGGGSVSDLFSERERAGGMAAFSFGPLMGIFHPSSSIVLPLTRLPSGPVIGPIAGAYLCLGWLHHTNILQLQEDSLPRV